MCPTVNKHSPKALGPSSYPNVPLEHWTKWDNWEAPFVKTSSDTIEYFIEVECAECKKLHWAAFEFHLETYRTWQVVLIRKMSGKRTFIHLALPVDHACSCGHPMYVDKAILDQAKRTLPRDWDRRRSMRPLRV